MNVVFYTIGCPKCKILEMKLKSKKIDFTIVDDKDAVIKKAEEMEIDGAPFISVDGDFMNFNKSINWLKEMR